MSGMDTNDLKQFSGPGGDFFKPSSLQPGQSIEVQLVGLDKQYKTQYPIKDKDYCYRISFVDADGRARIFDANGTDVLRQVVAALYPNGPEGALVACRAKLTRRTARRKNQGELEITRLDGE